MVRPVSESTLAAISGKAQDDAVKGFVNTIQDVAKLRLQQQEAAQLKELRGMQIQEAKQQQAEFAKNAQLREQERKANIMRLQSEMQTLPQQTQNALQEGLNTKMQLKTEGVDLAFTDLGLVRGAKGYRKWLANNKDKLKDLFDSDDQYKEFLQQPFSIDRRDQLLREWRSNKPGMIDKMLEYEMQADLAKAKAKADATIPASKTQAIKDEAASLKTTYNLDDETAKVAADAYVDMAHQQKIPRTQVRAIMEETIKELGGAGSTWWSKSYEPAEFRTALRAVRAREKYQATGTGLPAVDSGPGSSIDTAIPVPATIDNIDSWAEENNLTTGTWVNVNGKPMRWVE